MLNRIENKNCKILVVDDVSQNIQVIGNILYDNNYQVSFALSGPEALTLLDHENYDLILLDILMPGMDGYEVCKIVKANQKISHIPIIFLTAKSDTDSILKGFELGAVDYLSKPFNTKELLARVKTQIELKKQREQLENINELLEEKVKIRTTELQKANEQLQKLEQAKGKFLNLISHELRTPLNVINGFIEILYPSLKETEHEQTIKTLMSVTDKLISLSETALLITELQLGEYLIEFTDVDIAEISLKVATTYDAAMKEKDIQLIANFDENARIIHGDDELIRNSVNKILQNAIKFTPKYGLIQIQSTKNDLFVELIVTNSGDGFSEETLEKLFEIFAIDKMTNFSDGFGLGLASVKLAMEVQSGRIEVKNHAEGGASVTLMFSA
jgi:two-component system sensor histidine kinase/response regulator